MSNVRSVEFRPTVHHETVEMLTRLLEQAKSGEIVSGNFCGSAPNGEIITDFTSSENVLLEIAGVSRLLHRMHIRADENMRVTE